MLLIANFAPAICASAEAQPLALKPNSPQVSAGVPGFWDPRRRCASAEAQPLALKPNSPQVSAGVPGFWDPRRRPERPDLSHISGIRFLTEVDFPPFDFAGTDGNSAGFNVDLARLICEDLKVSCTVQMRRFDTLLSALAENRGDAVIASLAPSPALRQRVDFTDPYYRSPARFVALREAGLADAAPERLEGKKIAVVSSFHSSARLVRAVEPEDRRLLYAGHVDLLARSHASAGTSDHRGKCSWRSGTRTGGRKRKRLTYEGTDHARCNSRVQHCAGACPGMPRHAAGDSVRTAESRAGPWMPSLLRS
jgi:Bacterial extracellular solute-binding proteins, family 3